MAVWAYHGRDVLSEEAKPLIDVALIATLSAS